MSLFRIYVKIMIKDNYSVQFYIPFQLIFLTSFHSFYHTQKFIQTAIIVYA